MFVTKLRVKESELCATVARDKVVRERVMCDKDKAVSGRIERD